MKLQILSGLALAFFLGACGQPAASVGDTPHGRYAGIGIYQAGKLWPEVVANQSGAAASAKTSDDDTIIAVIDSRTGEIRQCGNLSGVCVGMNPWTKALAQTSPVALTAHTAIKDINTVQGNATPVPN